MRPHPPVSTKNPPIDPEKWIVVLGAFNTGKDRLIRNMSNPIPHTISRLPRGTRAKTIDIDDKSFLLKFLVLCPSLLIRAPSPQMVDLFVNNMRNAAGAILVYDMTSRKSFDYVTKKAHWLMWKCRSNTHYGFEAGKRRFGGVLVGTKKDVVRRGEGGRQVCSELAESWAAAQGWQAFEVDDLDGVDLNVKEEVARALVRSVVKAEKRDEDDLEDMKVSSTGRGENVGKLIRKQNLNPIEEENVEEMECPSICEEKVDVKLTWKQRLKKIRAKG